VINDLLMLLAISMAFTALILWMLK